MDPSKDTALPRIPGTNIGPLCSVEFISPSNLSPTMLSNGKYKSGARSNVQIEFCQTSRIGTLDTFFSVDIWYLMVMLKKKPNVKQDSPLKSEVSS